MERANDLRDAVTSLLATVVDESPPFPAAEFAKVKERWTAASLQQMRMAARDAAASTRTAATRRMMRRVVGVLLDIAQYAHPHCCVRIAWRFCQLDACLYVDTAGTRSRSCRWRR
jgi:hypothetical protein